MAVIQEVDFYNTFYLKRVATLQVKDQVSTGSTGRSEERRVGKECRDRGVR